MQDALKAGASSLDLQLFGAIPPITEARRLDTAGKAAIVQSERQAARTLIQKSKQAGLGIFYLQHFRPRVGVVSNAVERWAPQVTVTLKRCHRMMLPLLRTRGERKDS